MVRLENRYNVLTNENAHSDDDTHDSTSDKVGSRKTRKRVNRRQSLKNSIASHLKLFSTNGAGVVGGKVNSLKSAVRDVTANLITIQETHCRRKGKILIDDFVIFEAIRKAKGGGTLIACHEDLKPKLIEEYEDDFELLVVEIKVNEKDIKVISGYGPQENWPEEKRN